MINDRTRRSESLPYKGAARVVGPGSYEVAVVSEKVYQKPVTIPRAAKTDIFSSIKKRKKKKNSGSIRADFEESGSESEDNGQ